MQEFGMFFLNKASKVKTNERHLQWMEKHRRMLTNMINRAKFFDLAHAEQTYTEYLGRPQTAVVMPTECFREDWRVFKTVASKTGRSFGHNLHEDDGLFKSMTGFLATTKFGKEHGTIMEYRLRGLTHSGIYWQWRRWELYEKAHELGIEESQETVTNERGLDFENSEIGVAFRCFLLGIIIGCVMFVSEIVHHCFGSRSSQSSWLTCL